MPKLPNVTTKESVADFLRRALIRDKEKGMDDGFRSTREVSDACGLSLDTARRHLWDAANRGEVDAYDGGASGDQGNEILWKVRQEKQAASG